MLVYIGADFVHPFVYRCIIDLVSAQTNPAQAWSKLLLYLIILASALFVHRIFRDLAGFALLRINLSAMKNLSLSAFNYVSRLSYKFHISNFAGSTARKINRGVYRVETVFDVIFYDLVPVSLTMIIAVIVLSQLNFIIGLPLIIGLVVFISITFLMVKKRMKLDARRNKTENKASGAMIDSITNNLTVKTFVGEKYEKNFYGQRLEKWRKASLKAWDFDVLTSLFQGGFIALLEIVSISLSLYLWKQGVFTVGDIVFVQANIGLLMFPMWTLGRFYRNFRRAQIDLQDLMGLMNKPINIKNKTGAKNLKVSYGAIEFNNVVFSYKKNAEPVLKNISLKIKPGEKIALVGHSGAGKTTFIKLLFRFIEPSKGKILIDNQDITKVKLNSLRKSLSLVPQEPLLFHRSVFKNIAYGRQGANLKQVKAAAKLAHAHEFIKNLPQGYNSLVGERGIKLSGGERQRIALARVFLENAPILILDEATSSLDSVSENLIQQALNNLMRNRTTIVIAHRLSTVRKMDRIIVLKCGRIIEIGSHQDLLNKENSVYKNLWFSQVGKFM